MGSFLSHSSFLTCVTLINLSAFVVAPVILLETAIQMCISTIVIAIYKFLKMIVTLLIGLVVWIYKFFRILVLLLKGLAIGIYKSSVGIYMGSKATIKVIIAAVIVIYKGCKMTAVGTLYVCKFLKPAATAILGIRTSEDPRIRDPNSRDDIAVEIKELQDGNLSVERLLTTMARERPIRFTSEQLEIITRDYAIKLGAGGFGDVYQGKLENGVKVAVKVLKNDSDRRVHEQFMAEVGTIGRTYHVNLVKLCGFCFTPTKRALVYEYMENGSLDRLLFGQSWLREWVKLHDIAIGTAKGIAYLHEGCEQRIIHYDIKPANVLLDLNLNPKVADFGLAQLCNTGTSLITLTGYRGTPGYAAPELWMPYPVTRKCDVYSFGMLLFEIVARKENYDKHTQQWLPRFVWDMFVNDELLEMVVRFGIEEQEREKAVRMCTVALWCVQYLAEARPIMSTVVKMLEGVAEIPPPPNPFGHMRSNTFDSEGSYSDSMATSSSYIDEDRQQRSHTSKF